MKKKEQFSVPALGGGSLLMVFGVLCLMVFALLCLSSVQAERRLSQAAARSVTAYYDAENEAEEIFARLRLGEEVPGVVLAQGKYSYFCPISENSRLEVVLSQEGGNWKILRWQVISRPEERTEAYLPLWTGGKEQEENNG